MKVVLLTVFAVLFFVALASASSHETSAFDEDTYFGGSSYHFSAEPVEPESIPTALKTSAGSNTYRGGATSATTTGFNGAPKGTQYPIPPY